MSEDRPDTGQHEDVMEELEERAALKRHGRDRALTPEREGEIDRDRRRGDEDHDDRAGHEARRDRRPDLLEADVRLILVALVAIVKLLFSAFWISIDCSLSDGSVEMAK